MKNLKHTLSIILIIIISSCTNDEFGPSNEQIELKAIFKEAIILSQKKGYYNHNSDNNTYIFFSGKFFTDLKANFPTVTTQSETDEEIIFNLDNSLNKPIRFENENSSQLDQFKKQLFHISSGFSVGQSKHLKDKLDDFSDAIYYSELSDESKTDLANRINLAYTAFLAIEEVALETMSTINSSSNTLYSNQGFSSGDCNYDWDAVIDGVMQGMFIGGVVGAYVGGIGGLVSGLGVASVITGPLGAFAGANLGAVTGAIDGFFASASWQLVQYLICLAQESSNEK